ncbi:MAG: hypothetical protein GX447_07905 [Elusimicrobia bacterium]|nr:hypothetical protein [Elusimicrobiota bacterium]
MKTKHGLSSAFLTFYEPGDRVLQARGYKVFSIHKESPKFSLKADFFNIKEIEKKYALSNIRSLILHEKLTFQRYDEQTLLNKLLTYDAYFTHVLKNNSFGCIIQELGAFIAPISLYFCAKSFNINHIFIEPALFRGYVFLNYNSIDVNLESPIYSSDRANYLLEEYKNQYHGFKTVSMPVKDRHHFMDAGLKKLINVRNIKRLSEKLYYKYIRGEKEEYDAIYNHVKRGFASVVRRASLSSFYSSFDKSQSYIYFPLHVPLDFQLTFREPKYLNQLAIVEYISNVLPYGIKLYIKEHPASIGAYDFWQLKKILKLENVKLINPSVNSYDIIKNSMFVVTINSKVGAEALFQGKKVYAFGSPYYISNKYAMKLNNLEDFKSLNFSQDVYSGNYFDRDFFHKLASGVSIGELYFNSPENLENFSNSLIERLKK